MRGRGGGHHALPLSPFPLTPPVIPALPPPSFPRTREPRGAAPSPQHHHDYPPTTPPPTVIPSPHTVIPANAGTQGRGRPPPPSAQSLPPHPHRHSRERGNPGAGRPPAPSPSPPPSFPRTREPTAARRQPHPSFPAPSHRHSRERGNPGGRPPRRNITTTTRPQPLPPPSFPAPTPSFPRTREPRGGAPSLLHTPLDPVRTSVLRFPQQRTDLPPDPTKPPRPPAAVAPVIVHPGPLPDMPHRTPQPHRTPPKAAPRRTVPHIPDRLPATKNGQRNTFGTV